MVIHQTACSENFETPKKYLPKNHTLFSSPGILKLQYILSSSLRNPQLQVQEISHNKLGSSISLHLPWVIASPNRGIARSWRRAPIICHWASTPQGILQSGARAAQRIDVVGYGCLMMLMMDVCVWRRLRLMPWVEQLEFLDW